MWLHEKEALVLTILILNQITRSHCVTNLRKDALQRYLETKEIKTKKPLLVNANNANTAPTKSMYKAYNFPEIEYPFNSSPRTPFYSGSNLNINPSPFKSKEIPISRSKAFDDLKKEMRMKRKFNRMNENLETTLTNFSPGSESFNLIYKDMFPEVQYPMNAMETWVPYFWDPSMSIHTKQQYDQPEQPILKPYKKQLKSKTKQFMEEIDILNEKMSRSKKNTEKVSVTFNENSGKIKQPETDDVNDFQTATEALPNKTKGVTDDIMTYESLSNNSKSEIHDLKNSSVLVNSINVESPPPVTSEIKYNSLDVPSMLIRYILEKNNLYSELESNNIKGENVNTFQDENQNSILGNLDVSDGPQSFKELFNEEVTLATPFTNKLNTSDSLQKHIAFISNTEAEKASKQQIYSAREIIPNDDPLNFAIPLPVTDVFNKISTHGSTNEVTQVPTVNAATSTTIIVIPISHSINKKQISSAESSNRSPIIIYLPSTNNDVKPKIVLDDTLRPLSLITNTTKSTSDPYEPLQPGVTDLSANMIQVSNGNVLDLPFAFPDTKLLSLDFEMLPNNSMCHVSLNEMNQTNKINQLHNYTKSIDAILTVTDISPILMSNSNPNFSYPVESLLQDTTHFHELLSVTNKILQNSADLDITTDLSTSMGDQVANNSLIDIDKGKAFKNVFTDELGQPHQNYTYHNLNKSITALTNMDRADNQNIATFDINYNLSHPSAYVPLPSNDHLFDEIPKKDVILPVDKHIPQKITSEMIKSSNVLPDGQLNKRNSQLPLNESQYNNTNVNLSKFNNDESRVLESQDYVLSSQLDSLSSQHDKNILDTAFTENAKASLTSTENALQENQVVNTIKDISPSRQNAFKDLSYQSVPNSAIEGILQNTQSSSPDEMLHHKISKLAEQDVAEHRLPEIQNFYKTSLIKSEIEEFQDTLQSDTHSRDSSLYNITKESYLDIPTTEIEQNISQVVGETPTLIDFESHPILDNNMILPLSIKFSDNSFELLPDYEALISTPLSGTKGDDTLLPLSMKLSDSSIAENGFVSAPLISSNNNSFGSLPDLEALLVTPHSSNIDNDMLIPLSMKLPDSLHKEKWFGDTSMNSSDNNSSESLPEYDALKNTTLSDNIGNYIPSSMKPSESLLAEKGFVDTSLISSDDNSFRLLPDYETPQGVDLLLPLSMKLSDSLLEEKRSGDTSLTSSDNSSYESLLDHEALISTPQSYNTGEDIFLPLSMKFPGSLLTEGYVGTQLTSSENKSLDLLPEHESLTGPLFSDDSRNDNIGHDMPLSSPMPHNKDEATQETNSSYISKADVIMPFLMDNTETDILFSDDDKTLLTRNSIPDSTLSNNKDSEVSPAKTINNISNNNKLIPVNNQSSNKTQTDISSIEKAKELLDKQLSEISADCKALFVDKTLTDSSLIDNESPEINNISPIAPSSDIHVIPGDLSSSMDKILAAVKDEQLSNAELSYLIKYLYAVV